MLGVAEPMSRTGGSFIRKIVRNKPYVYFQFNEFSVGRDRANGRF